MKLIWIRHGETDWNKESRLQGLSDVALNERGEKQSRLLAASFPDRPDRIFVSPLSRARAFAAPLAERFGLSMQVVPELREIAFGRWEGLRYADMDTDMRDLFVRWREAPQHHCPPEGEPLALMSDRVAEAIRKITAAMGEEESAAVVTHGGVIRVALSQLFGFSAEVSVRLSVDTGSVSVTQKLSGGWWLVKLNDTCHCQLRNTTE